MSDDICLMDAVTNSLEIDNLRNRVAHLEANRDYWWESCQQAQAHRDEAGLHICELEARIAELEAELLKYRR